MTHPGAGIQIDSAAGARRPFVWALGLSVLLHALLVTLSISLLPVLAGRWSGPGHPERKVLEFRFRDRTADVDPASRVAKPPPTPLLGRFDSAARDRVRDARDTPFPAGGAPSTENSLPGSEGEGGAPTSPDPGAQATGLLPDPTGAGIADALGSEVAMLTGRREPARRPGHGARFVADGTEAGALQFGDFAFSTRAWEWEPYWVYMRERLYANWHPPAAYVDYGIIQGGWTLVRAVLDRQGRLRDARIIGENGHASLHPASFAAMQGAAPFRPLPADFPEDSLVVTVKFIYMRPGVAPEPVRP